jgi:hypothetical protein
MEGEARRGGAPLEGRGVREVGVVEDAVALVVERRLAALAPAARARARVARCAPEDVRHLRTARRKQPQTHAGGGVAGHAARKVLEARAVLVRAPQRPNDAEWRDLAGSAARARAR